MKPRDYIVLFLLQLAALLVVAHYQTIPGNYDADYYFVTGLQLAQGKGFTEPFIWNYLNDPVGIPQASHSYWSPLASIVAALGMTLTGLQTFSSGRIFFILIAACIPPLTAALAHRITARRGLAYVAGLFAVFSVFYIPYLPITENYGIVMALGALIFLLLDDSRRGAVFLLGILSGLMALARNDGLIWLAILFLLIGRRRLSKDSPPLFSRPVMGAALIDIFLALSGFALIMAPWYFRNIMEFGAPISASARRVFWVTNYYETFIYPASGLNYSTWVEKGWDEILRVRWWSLRQNLLTAFVVQGGVAIWPFMLIGIIKMWQDFRVRLGVYAWILLFFILAFVFGTIGARGGFFHAGSAFQPLWWSMASIGVDTFASRLQKYKILSRVNFAPIFRFLVIEIALVLSAISVWTNVFADGWQDGELEYPQVERFLIQQGILPDEPVMVLNPPGYFMMTQRPAIMFPYGGEDSILSASKRYNARYIILKIGADDQNPYTPLYSHPDLYQNVKFIGEVDGTKIFLVQDAR